MVVIAGTKFLINFLILITAGMFVQIAHAEGSCPEGMAPMGQKCEGGYCIPNCAPGDYSQQSQPQQLPPVKWADRWGAVAIGGGSGHPAIVGLSENMANRGSAETTALSKCKSQRGGETCSIRQSYSNGCIALAWGNVGGGGVAVGHDANEAKEKSLALCGKNSSDCEVLYTGCSMPVRIQ
jgi:hypothetical protein